MVRTVEKKDWEKIHIIAENYTLGGEEHLRTMCGCHTGPPYEVSLIEAVDLLHSKRGCRSCLRCMGWLS